MSTARRRRGPAPSAAVGRVVAVSTMPESAPRSGARSSTSPSSTSAAPSSPRRRTTGVTRSPPGRRAAKPRPASRNDSSSASALASCRRAPPGHDQSRQGWLAVQRQGADQPPRWRVALERDIARERRCAPRRLPIATGEANLAPVSAPRNVAGAAAALRARGHLGIAGGQSSQARVEPPNVGVGEFRRDVADSGRKELRGRVRRPPEDNGLRAAGWARTPRRDRSRHRPQPPPLFRQAASGWADRGSACPTLQAQPAPAGC